MLCVLIFFAQMQRIACKGSIQYVRALWCRVTRDLLRKAQHQVALLINENRRINGVRDRKELPAWSDAVLKVDHLEFRNIEVSLTDYSNCACRPAHGSSCHDRG